MTKLMNKHKAKLAEKADAIFKEHGYTPTYPDMVLLSLYKIARPNLTFIVWVGQKRSRFLRETLDQVDGRLLPSPIAKQHFDFWMLNHFED